MTMEKMKLWTLLSLVLCAVALFAVASHAVKLRRYQDEPMWIEEPFVIEGARAVREEGGSAASSSSMGVLKRLNPKKRFTYARPSATECSGTESPTDVSVCFSYFKNPSNQKWYMKNCCACAVDTKFNIRNPALLDESKQPYNIFFNQGDIPSGMQWRLFFMDDNPTLEPLLFSADLVGCASS